jgi:hypothetical protein
MPTYAILKATENLDSGYQPGDVVEIYIGTANDFSDIMLKSFIIFEIDEVDKLILQSAVNSDTNNRTNASDLNDFKSMFGDDIVDNWKNPRFTQPVIQGKSMLLKNSIKTRGNSIFSSKLNNSENGNGNSSDKGNK